MQNMTNIEYRGIKAKSVSWKFNIETFTSSHSGENKLFPSCQDSISFTLFWCLNSWVFFMTF